LCILQSVYIMNQGSVTPFILNNHPFHSLCQSKLQLCICQMQC
jgi:hypothetical protein